MPTTLDQLVSYCNTLLNIDNFKDYCPNGLQVQGKKTVKTIVTGVTASQALLDAAISLHADAILVHHGFFWRGEQPNVTGIKRNRLHALLQHDISLLTYHIPLDAHPKLGNNAQLATQLGLQITGTFPTDFTPSIGLIGKLAEPMSAEYFAEHIATTLQRKPLHIKAHQRPLHTIAWCTGGAQDYIEAAASCGVDAYISGEISERTTHSARELEIDYFSAGHHATERYGIKALGKHVAKKFDLVCEFIDIDNPV